MMDSNNHLYAQGYEDCKAEVLAILKREISVVNLHHDMFLTERAKSKCNAIN
jgi:hypothetical protein